MNNTGYVCLMIVLKMLGIKNDPKTIEEKFEKTDDTDFAIIGTAKELGLKVKVTKFSSKLFDKLTVPAIAKCRDGEYILILNVNENKCKILKTSSKVPEVLEETELRKMIDGECIIVGRKVHISDDESLNTGVRFGFKWFIPTILKFKKQFITVLVAVLGLSS